MIKIVVPSLGAGKKCVHDGHRWLQKFALHGLLTMASESRGQPVYSVSICTSKLDTRQGAFEDLSCMSQEDWKYVHLITYPLQYVN